MPSFKRRIINSVSDLLFRFVDYDRFFYLLGGLPVIQTNEAVRTKFIAEVRKAISRYGMKQKQRPVTLPNGLKFADSDLRDYVQFNLYFLRGYSNDELDLVAKHLSPGDIFVDVGANIGLFSLLAAQKVGPNGRVLAFEPASDTTQQFKSNSALNNMDDRIQFFQYALSDSKGELTLYDSDVEQDDLGKRSFFQKGEATETVPVRVFDELVASGEVQIDRPIGVIKIDVEGAELMVLKGMRESIVTHKPRLIVFEINEPLLQASGTSAEELDSFMVSCGYQDQSDDASAGPTRNAIYVPV